MADINFQEHLSRQIGFIARSAWLYDQGYLDEAVRIATAIRVLIHETNKSTPLLRHLGAYDTIRLASSNREQPEIEGTLVLFDGVSELSLGEGGIRPSLVGHFPQQLLISEWWNESVLVSASGVQHTRRTITLACANKDGGAHVDDDRSKAFVELIEGMFTYSHNDGDPVDQVNHHFIAMRVFAHELLHSPELLALVST